MELQKKTKRTYDDACGAAHALDLVGERWALLVMRELMLGPRRFSELRRDLPGISANVLTQRLEGLEAAGVLVRRRLPPPASAQVYELTSWGYEAEPIFQVLGRWAARSPAHDPALPLSAASLMLSFRTMFDPARAKGEAALAAMRIGEEDYRVAVKRDGVTVERAVPADPDFRFMGPATAIAGAVYGGASFETLAELKVDGDRDLARRFATWFPLPPKAELRPEAGT